jgi:hypothetical protein
VNGYYPEPLGLAGEGIPYSTRGRAAYLAIHPCADLVP